VHKIKLSQGLLENCGTKSCKTNLRTFADVTSLCFKGKMHLIILILPDKNCLLYLRTTAIQTLWKAKPTWHAYFQEQDGRQNVSLTLLKLFFFSTDWRCSAILLLWTEKNLSKMESKQRNKHKMLKGCVKSDLAGATDLGKAVSDFLWTLLFPYRCVHTCVCIRVCIVQANICTKQSS